MALDDSSTRRLLEWLTGANAASWLQETHQQLALGHSPLQLAKWLRKSLSPEQARLVQSQAELRLAAVRKFPDCHRMLFTDKGLQQATAQSLAAYKAVRFHDLQRSRSNATDPPPIVDLCCGIGGDLMELAKPNGAVGVDADPPSAWFARYNCRGQATVHCLPAEQFQLPANSLIHIDPDRRPDSPRHRRQAKSSDRFCPNTSFLVKLVERQADVAVKVAPVTELPDRLQTAPQIEWIGDQRECKQQVWWFGDLAKPGAHRTATAVAKNGRLIGQVSATEQEAAAVAGIDQPQTYLFDVHPTVRAAKLMDALALQCDLRRLRSGNSYLTSNRQVHHPLVTSYYQLGSFPIDEKRILRYLKQLDAGSVTIKRRGVGRHVFQGQQNLELNGNRALFLFVTRVAEQHRAIVTAPPSEAP